MNKKQYKKEAISELINKINNDSEFEKNIVDLIDLFAKAREEYGVCSLSEKNDSQIMWQMYTDNYQGISNIHLC